MKKSIFTLAMALVAFGNVAMASTKAATINTTTSMTANYRGTTPLANAIIKGDVEAVKKFIDYGCDVNERSNGMTPLMLAARYNQAEIITLLIEKGANIKHTDDKGQTAMKYAERSNATLAIEALKAAKA